jgi:hypothetical protein
MLLWQAARLLHDLAESLKGHMKGYLIPSLTTLLTLVTNKHSSDVRATASMALAKVFDGVLDAVEKQFLPSEQLPEILAACLGRLLVALTQDVHGTSRGCAAECLKDILHACYLSGEEGPEGYRSAPMCSPGVDISTGIMTELLTLSGESLDRYKAITDSFAQNEGLEEEDKEGIEDVLEEEEDILRNLVDGMGELIKLHRGHIMPVFDSKVAAIFSRFLGDGVEDSLKAIAVCLLDDVIEYGEQPARKYVSQLFPLLASNFGREHTVLRQSSVYGVAQCLRACPEESMPFVSNVIPALLALVNHPNAKQDEYEGTTENALFALGILCCNPVYRNCSWGPVEAQQVCSRLV